MPITAHLGSTAEMIRNFCLKLENNSRWNTLFAGMMQPENLLRSFPELQPPTAVICIPETVFHDNSPRRTSFDVVLCTEHWSQTSPFDLADEIITLLDGSSADNPVCRIESIIPLHLDSSLHTLCLRFHLEEYCLSITK